MEYSSKINEMPNGLTIQKDYIDQETEENLINLINIQPWNDSLSRKTQHYGYEYNYNFKDLKKAEKEIPAWITDLFPGKKWDQCIINRYLPGQGIAPHTDSPLFADDICSLSLGSPCTMFFIKDQMGKQFCDVWLPSRSLLTMSGEARNQWKHQIPARKIDFVPGEKRRVKRGVRYSITVRNLA